MILQSTLPRPRPCLGDNGAGGGALVPPGGRQNTDGLVVPGETMDAGLDQNQAELGVLVLAVALEVLPDGDGLLRLVRISPTGVGGLPS